MVLSEIESGFGEPGGTPPPQISRSTPPPPTPGEFVETVQTASMSLSLTLTDCISSSIYQYWTRGSGEQKGVMIATRVVILKLNQKPHF